MQFVPPNQLEEKSIPCGTSFAIDRFLNAIDNLTPHLIFSVTLK